MDAVKLRAWLAHRQGLDGSLSAASPAEILEKTGWARSVGGSAPYLALFARGGVTREQADQAVAHLEIHELPAARGCTYVVPASDFALALKIAQDSAGDAEMKVARKLGVTDSEIDKLCVAVVKALGKGALDPDGIRDAVGPAARSLGDEGKKKGVTTTLPLALGRLQSEGEIRRVPVNGRLDQQRYRYTLWQPNPLKQSQLSTEEALRELALRYWRWAGPASLAEFQWFSGLGVKAAKAVVDPLHLKPAEPGDARLFLPGDSEQFEAFRVPKAPRYALVAALDGIMLLRRNLQELLDPHDTKRMLPTEKGMQAGGALADLPSHAILDRGRVAGVWEYDIEKSVVAWLPFVLRDDAMVKAVAAVEEFVRVQLGDARGFSLDSPKSRAPKIAAIRAASA